MSGRKDVIKPYKIASSQSLAASFSSSSLNIQYLDRVGISMDCAATSGSAVGSFVVQGRISPSAQAVMNNPLPPGPSDEWGHLDIDTMSLVGADKNFVIDIINTGLIELRVTYTRVSGTGSADIWISAKEV